MKKQAKNGFHGNLVTGRHPRFRGVPPGRKESQASNSAKARLTDFERLLRRPNEPCLQLLRASALDNQLEGWNSRADLQRNRSTGLPRKWMLSRCIIQDKSIPAPGEMGLRDMRMVLVVIERARLDGQPVTVPTS